MSFPRGHVAGLALLIATGPATAVPAPSPAGDLALLPAVVGATERYASDGRSGLGLSGYDPVSYGLDGRPRPGLARHEAVLEGLAWRFASEANREAFLRDPHAFLPRIGGYDADSAANGRIVSADPLLYLAREGRLYLFRSPESRARFLDDAASAAAAAERSWERLRTGLVGG